MDNRLSSLRLNWWRHYDHTFSTTKSTGYFCLWLSSSTFSAKCW